jgi:hypothetical protein
MIPSWLRSVAKLPFMIAIISARPPRIIGLPSPSGAPMWRAPMIPERSGFAEAAWLSGRLVS